METDYREKLIKMMSSVEEIKRDYNFDNLWNYLFCICELGEYSEIGVRYHDSRQINKNGGGSEYITICSNYGKASIYKIMNENTPLEEKNQIRFFDEDGEYREVELKEILNFFNKTYKRHLRTYHIVE